MDAVVQENIESMFISVLDIMDAPRGLAVTDVYDDFAEEADEWLDACDNPGAQLGEKTLARFVDSIMSIARQVGLVLPMQTMLYYKALLTIDGVVLRVYPDFDYKKESRRAIRLIRMRELEKMYGPGEVIDRALSLQLLANAMPDFLIQRLQDFEQGKKTIYRKLNLLPVIIAHTLRFLALGVALGGVALLAVRMGWLRVIPVLSHPYVVGAVQWLAPVLYAAPVLLVVLLWLARFSESRSYKKVQKDE
jgi:predicted unusual protein kinase regulating ubiquinone biosynthesis (AarF/ABC1/UbiB family)